MKTKINNINVLKFGFYTLHVQFNGKVRMYSTKGRSFVGNADCSGAAYNEFNSVNQALEKAKEWGLHIWNNNDRLYLIREYGLNREFVTDFLGYVWPIEKNAECECCDSWIDYETGNCDCDGMREMLEAGLEMSGTK